MQYRWVRGDREAVPRTRSALTAAHVPTAKGRSAKQFATRCTLLLAAVVLVATTTTVRGQSAASAQEPGAAVAPAAAVAAALEPIIVTARLRKARIQCS
jgi:acyl-coenzyme A synthetase/AMP-(fatty) acid ligase